MTEPWKIYDLLNMLWDVLRKYVDSPPQSEEDWKELAGDLERICGKYEDVPRLALLGTRMGAAVYNYFYDFGGRER